MPPATPAPRFDVQAQIAQLFVYPIKSCAGVALQDAVLTETGLDLDRAWMLVDQAGEFVSQRELPRMALIQPRLRHFDMVVRAPGMLALHLQIDTVEAACKVRVWNDEVRAFDMGDLAAQWFSTFLAPESAGGSSWPYRLVRFDPDHRRLSNLTWTSGAEAPNQFSDGYPVLVASTASLDGLNRRLLAAGSPAVGMERFRPNIVLQGLDEHDEDRMTEWHIATADGAVVLRPVKPCPRCPIPNIDPQTATSSPEVGDMLQTYRQDARVNGAVTFGMNAIIVSGQDQTLRVGQPVQGNYRFD
ncbi:MAG: MOSC N-terminal beta barrel domain-containing protein [Rhodoferax sp.]|nr:MOSC N-terminal beta barrel domain-containing protein [Rhodoferax sp.]